MSEEIEELKKQNELLVDALNFMIGYAHSGLDKEIEDIVEMIKANYEGIEL